MASITATPPTSPFVPTLYGRALRFVLVDVIRGNQTMTVAEMVDELAAQGHRLRGRPSKAISDSLRWELARGRIVRVRRGVYRFGRAPASTARRIRIFAEHSRLWLVAVMRTEQPPPTPQDTRRNPMYGPESPSRPPWENTAWLWGT